tara:strand:+ start:791 stop:1909 length:1119 start_codon:yes stop_codon:yes gene_type:complete
MSTQKENKINLLVWTRSGESLKIINEDLKQEFKEKYNLLNYTRRGDMLLMNHIHLDDFSKFSRRILIQPMDGTVMHPHIIEKINNFHYIVTPSNISKQLLENNGVTKPIRVIPNYYDNSLLDEDNGFFSSLFPEKKYTFYTESTAIHRKNIDRTLRNFLKEFTEEDNVRLVIKLNEVPKNRILHLKKLLKKYPNRPEVIIINKKLPKEYLHSLKKGIDCYICLSYMEGFCIPLLDAVVLKKDIITLDTKISGYGDFINEENSILLPNREIPIFLSPGDSWIYLKESKWENVDYVEYRKALRTVFNGEYTFNKNQDYSQYSQKNVIKQYNELLNLVSEEVVEREIKVRELAQRRYDEHFSKFRMNPDLNRRID